MFLMLIKALSEIKVRHEKIFKTTRDNRGTDGTEMHHFTITFGRTTDFISMKFEN